MTAQPLLVLTLPPHEAAYFGVPFGTYAVDTADGWRYLGAAVIKREMKGDMVELTFNYLHRTRNAPGPAYVWPGPLPRPDDRSSS